MRTFVHRLRCGDFLTRERMRLWAGGFMLGFVLCLLYLGVTAHGMNDYAGRPLGTDFSNVYAAGVEALRGHADAPFDILRQQKAERMLFGPETQLYGWHYPPFFLLIAAGLARLPYVTALLVWQATTLLLYLGALWLLLRKSAMPSLARDPLWLMLALGFTAVFLNLTHGQNGFLTAALFAAGLAVLDERPLLAGLLFGLICYKPQFAVLIPLVLAATGRWRSLLAAAATIAALGAAVTAIFGPLIWPAFIASAHFTRTVVLEDGSTGFHKIQSLFAWVRLWGGPVALAYALQLIADAAVVAALLRIWRSDIAIGRKGAALCLGALLITPYCLDYDLMLLAPALALLAAEGMRRGFAPYEIAVLAMLWFLPAAARTVAHYALLPTMVPAMAFAFVLIYRRCPQPGIPFGVVNPRSW